MNNDFRSLSSNTFINNNIGFFTQTDHDYSHKFHCHNFYEILYIIRGEMFHTFYGEEDTLLHTGDCVIIPPNSFHSFKPNAHEKFIKRDILVENDLFVSSCQSIPNMALFLQKKAGKTVISFSINELSQNEILFKKFTESTNIEYKKTLGISFLYSVFVKLFEVAPISYSSLIDTILTKLNHPKHLKNGIAEIAQELNYSQAHLCHVFKKEMGITMVEYINKIKLNHVAFFLVNTNLSLREIADTVGYDSLPYMHKKFLEKFNTTPMKYREQNKTKLK